MLASRPEKFSRRFLLILFTLCSLLAMPLIGQDASAKLIFPQIAGGEGFSSEIVLRNSADFEIRGSLHLTTGLGEAFELTLNGQSASQFSFVLPPRGVVRYLGDPEGALHSGYGVVEFDAQGGPLNGTALYRFNGSEVSVASSPDRQGHAGYVQLEKIDAPPEGGDSAIDTGLALVNPNDAPIDIHLLVLDRFGIATVLTDITLQPHQHLARFIDEEDIFGEGLEALFPDGKLRGTLHATSDSPFAMTLLRTRFPSGQIANLGTAGLQGTFAFQNVNLVSMESDAILAGQTVIVRGDRIAAIGPSKTMEIPAEAVTIDGTGRYLMPGLADMHVHLVYWDERLLYLANGVTTIREMWGSPSHVRLRNFIREGDLLGPDMLVAGPGFDAPPVVWPRTIVLQNPAEADAAMEAYQAEDYDFVKIYNNLAPEIYHAVVAAARARGISFVGHIPFKVGPEAVFAEGQKSIEHFLRLASLVTASGNNSWLQTMDQGRASQLANRFVDLGIWNCPTISTNRSISLTPAERDAILQSNEIRYMHPQRVADWQQNQANQFAPTQRTALMANMRSLLKTMNQAGSPLLLGTDAGFPLVFPGFSIHDELEQFVDAGLTPYRTLRIATRNAAEFMGRLDEVGTVAEGKRADLILLQANPLQDVGNVRNRAGVMVRGRWLPEPELQRRLEEQAARYESAGGAAGRPIAEMRMGPLRHRH